METDAIKQSDNEKVLLFKSQMLERLEKCQIKMDTKQLSIAVIQITYGREAYYQNKDIEVKIAVSDDALAEKIATDNQELVFLRKNDNQLDESEYKKLCEEKMQKVEDRLRREFTIYEAKRRKCEGLSCFFMLAKLTGAALEWKELIAYILQDIFAEIDSYGNFKSADFPKYYFEKMANQRVLLENYVEYYLAKNKLPSIEKLIELSAAKYEGSESEARIYFSASEYTDTHIWENGDLRIIASLHDEGKPNRYINHENCRMIRKLMEISKRGKIYLYAHREEGKDEDKKSIQHVISHLVTKTADDSNSDEWIYIQFFGYMCWSIVRGGREEIIYSNGKLVWNRSQEKKLYLADIDALKENLGEKIPEQWHMWFCEDRLTKLIEILEKQKHGTAVVIADCQDEAKRLCRMNRGTLLAQDMEICLDENTGNWDEERILSITGIDGALFMNTAGKCEAFGVIVDGKATKKGDVGCGARYNSLDNYISQQSKEMIYLAIIVSEDGMIKLISNQ